MCQDRNTIFGFRKYNTCLQKLFFNKLANLLLCSISLSSKNNPISSIVSSRKLDHMFSWLGVAILEFSFTINKRLLTTWLLTAWNAGKIQAFIEAKGQGSNMLRPEGHSCESAQCMALIVASQGFVIFCHYLSVEGNLFMGHIYSKYCHTAGHSNDPGCLRIIFIYFYEENALHGEWLTLWWWCTLWHLGGTNYWNKCWCFVQVK